MSDETKQPSPAGAREWLNGKISEYEMVPRGDKEVTDAILLIMEAYAESIAAPLLKLVERDRVIVAAEVTRIRAAVRSRDWLMDGRGSYEWDDDRWHSEFAAAAKEILDATEYMAKIAGDWNNCSNDPKLIAEARRLESIERELTAERTKREAAERELKERTRKYEALLAALRGKEGE